MKFAFDLRRNGLQANKCKYNAGFTATSDLIFLQNSRTIICVIGTTLTALAPSSATINMKFDSIIYNPYWDLSYT